MKHLLELKLAVVMQYAKGSCRGGGGPPLPASMLKLHR